MTPINHIRTGMIELRKHDVRPAYVYYRDKFISDLSIFAEQLDDPFIVPAIEVEIESCLTILDETSNLQVVALTSSYLRVLIRTAFAILKEKNHETSHAHA